MRKVRRLGSAFLSAAATCVLFQFAGCTDTSLLTAFKAEVAVPADKAALQLGFTGGDWLKGVTHNLSLPTIGPNGSSITWSSDNGAVTASGVVTRPVGTTKPVNLTATITKGSVRDTKTFQVVVVGTNTWVTRTSMPTHRGYFVKAAVVNNMIYVFGGRINQTTYSKIVEAYDPRTDSWSEKSQEPILYGFCDSATFGGNVYLFNSGGVEMYNPSTDSWTTDTANGGSLAQYASLDTRYYEGASVATDSDGKAKIFLVGGWSGIFLHKADVYDPIANTWYQKSSSSSIDYDWMPAVTIANKIYIAGTWLQTAVSAYDPVADTWSSLTPIPKAGAMYGAVVFNNKEYVMGGGWNSSNYYNNVQVLDPVGNNWTIDTGLGGTLAPMPTARYGLTAALVDNVIYCIGGTQDDINYLGTVEAYYP